MEDGIKLKTLSVGCADGKSESESSEYDFTDLFYTENSKVEEIMKPISCIISGRKGTGKTILARYVEVEQTRKHSILSSQYINLPDDIKQEEFIERNYTTIKEDEYNLFPKFYVLKTISKLILEQKLSLIKYLKYSLKNNFFINIRHYRRYQKAYNSLKQIQDERYPDGNYITRELRCETSNSEKAKMGMTLNRISGSGEISQTESVGKVLSFKNYAAYIDKLEMNVLKCVTVNPVMLIFDDIDDIKKYIDNDTQVEKFLIGMIKCVKEINAKIYSRNKLNKCIIIIRDDILQTLNALDGNLNKTIIDSEVNLDWIGNNQEDMLTDMVLHKISQGNATLKNKNPSQVLRMIFDGRSNQASKKKMEWIINCGFGRPRDIITFLSIIIKNNKESNKISFFMIKNAYNEYSNAFWNELQNELSFYYSKEFIKAIENILGSMGRANFLYKDIKAVFDENSTEYSCIEDFDRFMNTMYKFGIVGNFRRREDKQGKASFAYRKDGKSRLDKNDYITVHYGLRPVFNI